MKGVLSFFEQMGILNRAFVFGRMSGVPSFGTKTRTVGNNGGQYPATYAGLQAALTASSSGDTVIILANEAVPASLSATINVPSGVNLVGASPLTSTISMPAGTPTVPTITFRGNNWIESIGFYHRPSQAGTEGGICLCGSNHTFTNCYMDGNQDCLMLGDTSLNASAMAIGSADWNGSTTLTKTSAFTNYTWTSGDVFICTAGGTAGFYTISSKTADTLVLASSMSGSVLTGTVEGVVASQYNQWGGGTTFRDCKFTGWYFDFLRINAILGCTKSASPALHTIGLGVQDLKFFGCLFTGTAGGKFIIDWLLDVLIEDCVWDASTGQVGISGLNGAPQNASGQAHKPSVAVSSASSDSGGTTITQTGAFASYYWRQGDTLVVDSGTGATVGTYVVASKTDSDNIVISTSLGSSATSIVGRILAPFRLKVLNSVAKVSKLDATGGIVRASPVSAPASGTFGATVEFDNFKLDVQSSAAPTVLFKFGNFTNPNPKGQILVKNTVFPYCSAPYTNVGATPAAANNPPIYFWNSKFVGTTAANGSTSSDPADLWYTTNEVTGADGTKGVRLTCPIGESQVIRNTTASNLKVYPAAGGNIDAAGTNTAVTVAGNATKTFHRTTSTVYWSQ